MNPLRPDPADPPFSQPSRRSSRKSAVSAVAVLAAAVMSAWASVSATADPHSASPLMSARAASAVVASRAEGVPRAGHVFVIVGENTSLSQVTPTSAPYIAGVLGPRSATLKGYEALANSSSTGDYIEMTSGQSIACERNDDNPVNPDTDAAICHQNVPNIFGQLQRAGISWTEWMESMPHACAFYDDGTAWAGDVYGAHHNPAIYYDGIEGVRYVEDYNKPPKAACLHHVLPMGTTARNDTSTFDQRLASGMVPRFNFIVPNDCENGHDVCGPQGSVRQFDAFVRREVTKILASPAWNSSSVINITWDEQGDATPNNLRVGSIWYGAKVKPGTYSGTWTHASLLRTLEDQMTLPHIAAVATVKAITPIWR